MSAFGLLAIAELLWRRATGRFVAEFASLLATCALLNATTGFPRASSRGTFGADSGSLRLVGLMFVCIVLGMAARHIFYLRGPLIWTPFWKSLCVSPIVLLPLLGTLQADAQLAPIQVVSFCLLAFQNGFFWRVVFERAQSSLRGARAGAVLLVVALIGLPASAAAAGPPGIPARYAQFFVHYVDSRSATDKILNSLGLASGDVGRSFALVAGVATYPYLPSADRSLTPAAVDVNQVAQYLRDVESFDEIVVLRDGAVTDENFKYFFQSYFPERLRRFPKSRFLFAYSGHGIQDGSRGYLLQSTATSFEDKAHSISLVVLRSLYGEIVDSAYQSLALINACYSGAFDGRQPFGPMRQLVPSEPGAHVITAGGSRERTWYDPHIGPGSIFFEKLFAGLKGPADSQPLQRDGSRGDGIITVPELFDYLSAEVQIDTSKAQHPKSSDLLRNDSAGSFYFRNRDRLVHARLMAPWKPKGSFGPTPADDIAAEALASFERERLPEAAASFQKACGAGSNRGCAGLGRMVSRGLGGLAADPTRAAELFRQSCDAGDAAGCNGLGASYELGNGGLPTDAVTAVELYRRACDGGESQACRNLGGAYLNGIGGLAVDAKKAVEIYRKSCDEHGAAACAALGEAYEAGTGGLLPAATTVIELYREACDGGDARGCSNLGVEYETGKGGLAADARTAVVLYRTACDRGAEEACANLGLAAEYGKGGMAVDPKAAVELYRRACDWGSGAGCTNLALAYSTGKSGLPVDWEKAAMLYDRACKSNAAISCSNLGLAYLEGKPRLPADVNRAIELLEKACDLKHGAACVALAWVQYHGAGKLLADPKAAHALAKRACDDGDQAGCMELSCGLPASRADAQPAAEPRAALATYRRDCTAGMAGACSNLALMYENGQGGVAADSKAAVALDRRACDQGDAKGCLFLSGYYDAGKGGLTADRKTALQLREKACNLGSAFACLTVGFALASGNEGVRADPKIAAEFSKKGCDGGCVTSCTMLGALYVTGGGGVPVNYTIGVQFLQQACDEREANACNFLAQFAAGGRVMPTDTKKAAGYYRKACDLGLQESCESLSKLHTQR